MRQQKRTVILRSRSVDPLDHCNHVSSYTSTTTTDDDDDPDDERCQTTTFDAHHQARRAKLTKTILPKLIDASQFQVEMPRFEFSTDWKFAPTPPRPLPLPPKKSSSIGPDKRGRKIRRPLLVEETRPRKVVLKTIRQADDNENNNRDSDRNPACTPITRRPPHFHPPSIPRPPPPRRISSCSSTMGRRRRRSPPHC